MNLPILINAVEQKIKNPKFLYWNKECEKVLGYTSDEIIGNPKAMDLLYPDKKYLSNELKKWKNQNYRLKKQELKVRTKNGDYKIIEWSNPSFKIPGWGIWSTGIDITERKEMEQKLNFLGSITEANRDSIVVTNTNFDITYINKAFTELFGYSFEDLKGKTPDLLNADPQTEEIQKKIYETIEKDKIFLGESLNKKKDGSKFYCEYKVMPLKNEQNKIYAYTGIQRDISDRKKAENLLKQKELQSRLQFKGIPIPTFIFKHDNSDFKLVDYNDAAYKLTNSGIAKLVGKNISKLLIDRLEILKIFLECFNEKKSFTKEIKYRLFSTGETKIFSTKFAFIPPDYVLCHAEDITEKKQLEKSLQQSQKMAAIGTLAGGIAHEFNNLLFIITGNLELLKNTLPVKLYEKCNSHITSILSTTNRATNFISQILTFSRKNNKKIENVNMIRIIQEGLKMIKASMPAMVNIVENIKVDKAIIKGDSTQIYQILINLCTNAQYVLKKSGGIINISLDREIKNNKPHIKLSVKDTGPGIPFQIKDRIFEPFFTTKPVGEGAGMGLSVVHGIVESYQGKIELESTEKKGTTFHIFLPEHIEDIEVSDSIKYTKKNLRIIVVDDEPEILKIMIQMLKNKDHEVKSFSNGKLALKAFKKNHANFDLIITDQAMPKMSGQDLGKQILKIRPNIPIVLMTGFSDLIDQEKAKQIGFFDYITKPIKNSDFDRIINKVENKIN
jgi:PAS domain S-box-containing protein